MLIPGGSTKLPSFQSQTMQKSPLSSLGLLGISLHTDQCHIVKTFSETQAMLRSVIALHGQKQRYQIKDESQTSLIEVTLIIPHFYLPFLPMLLINPVQGHMPPSTLVQRSSDFCFLCPSICFPQMSNIGHASPVSYKSLFG